MRTRFGSATGPGCGDRAPGPSLVIAATLAACVTGSAWAQRPEPKVERTIEGDPVMRVLPKDAIPAIDEPVLRSPAEVSETLPDDAPVLGVFDGENARAYPTWTLEGHEIVNDRLGELPLAATW